MPNQVHQIGRVLTVVYGESGSDPDLVGIFAQKPSTDTVERSGPGQRFGHNAGAAAHNLSCDTLHAPGHLGRGAARKGHQQDPAGIGPVDDQMGDPVGHGVGLPGARAGDDQEGCPWSRVLLPDAMLDGSSLFAIEGLEIGDGHRWQIGLQQVKPINHLSRFVRNSYQVSTLPYAGRQGSSTVVPAEIEGTALTCRALWPCYERVRVVFLGF